MDTQTKHLQRTKNTVGIVNPMRDDPDAAYTTDGEPEPRLGGELRNLYDEIARLALLTGIAMPVEMEDKAALGPDRILAQMARVTHKMSDVVASAVHVISAIAEHLA